MKKCIWCSLDETKVNFKKLAHTFPQSLGGKNICDNVCDLCNSYFGSKTSQAPSVEVVLKEILNLSRHILLQNIGEINKIHRFKSEYFDINWKERKIKIKPRYSLRQGFQEKLCRQFRRGLYKVFLEERERQRKDASLDEFNFIREFARYDLSDLPVFLFRPKSGIVIFSSPDVINPEIRFTDNSDFLHDNYRIFEYQFIGHYFAIPSGRGYKLGLDNYKKKIKNDNHPFGTEIIEIKTLTDIDATFAQQLGPVQKYR